ncbi:MAG: LysR family transcriptional regulator [Eubacterium sp.]|nr:LysR family transcriptional regulator [Candidatus Colimonas fimequi]
MIKYHALIKVAELGSISKAAAALGYSQPGISHILNSFEEELGLQLFIRSMSGITLTEAGEDVLEYAKQIIVFEGKINEIATSRDHLAAGVIRIGAFASALVSFIPKAIKAFSEIYPNIQFQIEEYQAENMVNDLKTGRLDIAFIASRKSYSNDKDVPVGYTYEYLLSDKLCLLVNKNHPLAKHDKVNYDMLKECDLMVPTTSWNKILKIDLEHEDFASNIKYIATSDLALFSLVSHDAGVALVSTLESPIKFDDVVLKEFEEDTTRNIVACISDVNKAAPAIREFVATCKGVIADGDFQVNH